MKCTQSGEVRNGASGTESEHSLRTPTNEVTPSSFIIFIIIAFNKKYIQTRPVQADRQVRDRETDREGGREEEGQGGWRRDREGGKESDKETERNSERQRESKTDKETDRERDRQRERERIQHLGSL